MTFSTYDGSRPDAGFFGIGGEAVPAGMVFAGKADFGEGRSALCDTFGWCPASSTVDADEQGPFIRSFCRIETWRQLQATAADLWKLRAERWLRISEGERRWHERNLEGIEEPVYRPPSLRGGT